MLPPLLWRRSRVAAALLIELEPGNSSAQISGINSTKGVALVKVYEVP